MADYWKSQPRKFCQYCKCWIADNKPSIEFHERGKNHKENVAAKISEIKKKSVAKAKQEERMSKEFAAMEEAAMKAYQEDLKRLEREAAGIESPTPTTARPQPQVRPEVRPQVKPQVKPRNKPQAKKQPNKWKPRPKSMKQTEAQVWVEAQTDDGQTYYYNTITGESRWEKPERCQGGSSASAQPESSSGCPWMEAVSPEGYTYYYNSETGESSWEKPADFPSSEESGPSGEGEEKSPAPEPEPSEGDESSDAAPAPEETSEQPKVPKITFRKRKAEAEPSEEEGGGDNVSEEAPKEEAKETTKEEEVQDVTAEPEKKQEEAPQSATQAKRRRAANPYGAWEQIREEKDPYASVDLQLPQVEGNSSGAASEPPPPPEPKHKFKERVITSLGDEGGPALFRKTKAQNGKSRSLRQRDDDD